ncbi:MAG: calcium/sodium antiporter [Alphaproteobacteria bacterium]|nr:calcium/sodium antiporter [Alphaproteobacteria bacterium]
MYDYAFLAGGLVLLIVGGEMLVRGAATTAARLGMSPLLIGLTLVGFGTSTPELVTSVEASLIGSPGIAIGNIVGSNIANVLLILGVATLIMPLMVDRRALARDGTIVVFTAAAFVVVGYLFPFGRLVGTVFVVGLVAYLYYAYRQERSGAPEGHTAAFEKREAHDEVIQPRDIASEQTAGHIWTPILLAVAGLIVVILGGKLLVDGAVGIARTAGISETLIGLTIVSIGTSLPELVTSVIAALRRHGDVALGNILGSNIYNILGIGGATALIAPTTIPPDIVRFDSLVMLAVSLALLVVARTGYRISRAEGVVLLAGYGAYIYAIWPS